MELKDREICSGADPIVNRGIVRAGSTGRARAQGNHRPCPARQVPRQAAFSADGQDVGADDYPFVVHPVMDEGFQGVLYSRDGKVGKVPAERVIAAVDE